MKGKVLGGTLLVTGTTVGAGMLALPVLTGVVGLLPSSLILITCWLLTAYSAHLILESTLWFKKDVNLISIARHILGRTGAVVTWLAYMLLLYALTSAYIAGGTPLLTDGIHFITGWQLSNWMWPLLFLILFGSFIYSGTRAVDLINRLLMLGLALSYLLLLFFIVPHVDMTRQPPTHFQYGWVALPIVVASFGFQMIVPSLTHYLNRNVKQLRLVIWLGTGIPLIIYLFWQWAILGTVPLRGTHSLLSALQQGQPATQPLTLILRNPWLTSGAKFFAFFSIVTSFLGASLSLHNFLKDGLKVKEKGAWSEVLVAALTFAPPLAFVLLYPKGFIVSLEYAGIFYATLLQILPVFIIWKGRYYMNLPTTYTVKGGKWLLGLLLFYSLLVIVAQLVPFDFQRSPF